MSRFYQSTLSIESLQKKAPSIFAGDAASSVSNRYLHIPTSKILDAMLANDFLPVAAKQTRAKDSAHAKHVLHFSHKSISDRLTLNEEIPLIRVQNSHDGKSSFQIDTGFFRLICSNGLVMPGNMLNSARVIHKVGMENDVIEASYRVLDSFASQLEQVNAMKGVELNADERQILAESAVKLVFDADQIEMNVNRGRSLETTLLAARRSADQKNDLWTTFNRIQENAIKGGRRVYSATGNFSAMREVKSIDREKQINVELMALAQKMAALKGVSIAA